MAAKDVSVHSISITHGLGVRNTFAAVVVEPGPGFGDGGSLLVSLWLVCQRRVAERVGGVRGTTDDSEIVGA